MKKTWQKPQLIVLVRSKPEEAVLQFCKNAGANAGLSAGPSASHLLCMSVPPISPGLTQVCEACSTVAKS
jgi:hypothetical protein